MKYRNKPLEVEAMQWDGTKKCYKNLRAFTRKNLVHIEELQGIVISWDGRGSVVLDKDDWLVKTPFGEIELIKNHLFEKSYDPC